MVTAGNKNGPSLIINIFTKDMHIFEKEIFFKKNLIYNFLTKKQNHLSTFCG